MDQFRAISVPILTTLVIVGPLLDPGMIAFAFLFVCKWLTGVSSCVFGYMECKIRQVDRSDGFINSMVDGVFAAGARDPILPILATTMATIAILSHQE